MSQSQCGWSSSQTSYPLALVSCYLTNKLMGRGLLSKRQVPKDPTFNQSAMRQTTTFGISHPFEWLSPI